MTTDAPGTAESEDRSTHSRRPSSPLTRRLRELTPTLIWVIAGVSAVAAALSPARPVEIRAADAFWCALLGAAVVIVASRARRWALVWLGSISAVVGIGGDTAAQVCAAVLVALVGLVALSDRRDRLTAALIGALAVQALLRGPNYGFTGLPTLVAAVAIIPAMWSGYAMAQSRERRITRIAAIAAGVLLGLASISAAMATLEARSGLNTGEDRSSAGLDLIRSGDTAEAAESFDLAALQFGRASSSLEGPLTWAGRYLPVVGPNLEALRRVASAGEDLSRSASTTASTADYRSLTAEGGVVDVERIVALREPVADSAVAITTAIATVADARSVWLAPLVADGLDRFDGELADIREQTDLAIQGLAVAPALLGVDNPQRYFIAFSTPAESRNGGGFIGAYGLLAADGGRLELLESGNLSELNPRGGLENAYAFDPPPDWEERYGSYFVNLFIGNLAASPDWPTSTEVVGQLFPQTPGGVPIDGAIYTDPAALAGLLELTGPISVPGIDVVLDASNAEQFLLVDQYVEFADANDERKELLGDVAEATFDALTSRPLPGISTLTAVLGPLVESGHLRVSVFEPAPEAFLDRLGLSGRWEITPGSDYLSVRSANLNPNKIDALLHREIDVATTIDPATGELGTKVTVMLRNDAPRSGLPPYIIGNDKGQPPGTNQHLLTLHTPHQLNSVTLDGDPIGNSNEREFGAPVYSVVVDLPSESTRTLVFDLVGGVPNWPYGFEALPQATANPDRMTVRIEGAPGIPPSPQFTGELGPKVRIRG